METAFKKLWDHRPWWPEGTTNKEIAQYYFKAGVAHTQEEIEDLESENENLHIENDTLCSRLQNEQPGKCTACMTAGQEVNPN